MPEPTIGWVDRLAAMRALPGWLELPAADLGLLASIATPRFAENGQRLLESGQPLHSILVVVEGEVAVRRPGRELQRARARDIVGAVAGFARDRDGCECVSIGSSAVLELPLEDLEDLLEERLSLLLRWLRSVSRECLVRMRGEGVEARAHRPSQTVVAPPFGLVERISLLRRTHTFGTARIDGLASFARAAREVRLEASQALYRSGEDSESVAVIVDGILEGRSPEGTRLSFGPSDVIGVHETFGEERRWFDAVAEVPATLLVLGRDEMIDVWEDHPDVGLELLRALCAELLSLPGSVP